MKVIKNWLAEWWQNQKTCEKIAIVTVVISGLLQIIFTLVIPYFVLKFKYDIGIILGFLIILPVCVGAILYLTVCAFCFFASSFLNCKRNIAIFAISLIISAISATSVFVIGNPNIFSIPTKQDYESLLEEAESIKSEVDLYDKADYFSWNKESGKHYANFYTNNGEKLSVIYDKSFKITTTEWTDNIAVLVYALHLNIIVIMIMTIIVSYIASWVSSKLLRKDKRCKKCK